MMELKFVVLTIMVCVSMGTTSPNQRDRAEKSLLSVLGKTDRPPFIDRKKVQVPQAMLNLFQLQVNHEYESTALPLPGRLAGAANTVRSYTHQVSPIDERFTGSHRFRLNFDLTEFPENEIITSSELRLTIVPKDNRTGSLHSSHNQHQRVNVYDILKPGVKGVMRPVLRLTDTKLVHLHATPNEILMDVLPIVDRWIANPDENHGILVDIRSPYGEKVSSTPIRLKRASDEDEQSWQTAQPLLFLYAEDTNLEKVPVDFTDPRRRKRGASPDLPPSKSKPKLKPRDECHRHQLWVDFEKVGWNDWIVAPPGYEAFFCAGDCPHQFGDHLNATNHAVVQTLVHSVHPSAIPKPCCVPTSLASISMLYLDEHNKAVLKNYPDMVVEGCGCR